MRRMHREHGPTLLLHRRRVTAPSQRAAKMGVGMGFLPAGPLLRPPQALSLPSGLALYLEPSVNLELMATQIHEPKHSTFSCI